MKITIVGSRYVGLVTGADINKVRKGIGADARIGNKFIYPSMGYGGSCLPKDVQVLIRTAGEYNYDLQVLKAGEIVNIAQKSVLLNKMMNFYEGDVKDKIVALWGLSFKSHTDDMREAPSLEIVSKLLKEGARVKAYDPVATEEAKHHFGDTISYFNDLYGALIDSDCLAIVTKWPKFIIPNFNVIKKILKTPAIFDVRNVYDKVELTEKDFNYFCIGVGTSNFF